MLVSLACQKATLMEQELSKRLLQGETIVIPMASKSSQYSKRTLQEQKALKTRIEKLGSKYQLITNQIDAICQGGITYKTLKLIAEEASRHTGLKIDRLAHRTKQAMNCWLAENWEQISVVLMTSIKSIKEAQISEKMSKKPAQPNLPAQPNTTSDDSVLQKQTTDNKADPFYFEVPCKKLSRGGQSSISILPLLDSDRAVLGCELSG